MRPLCSSPFQRRDALFSALHAGLNLPAQTSWRTDRGRANAERRIKELRDDFAAGSFNTRAFWATEAALNAVRWA